MAGEMASQFRAVLSVGGRFPASQRFGVFEIETGVLAEVIEQAVGGETAHVAAVHSSASL
jgi:predicted ATP-dependent serine protease